MQLSFMSDLSSTVVENSPLTQSPSSVVRHNWNLKEVQALFALPFNDLMFKAQTVHRENFNPNEVQVSTLLSIKTGACPEDCKYCSQSARNKTNLEKESL
ncbi:MAG: biotin synthase, partial [Alteromonadales bacterium]|nr:biotin synthase [Alteromonadales bacterium]